MPIERISKIKKLLKNQGASAPFFFGLLIENQLDHLVLARSFGLKICLLKIDFVMIFPTGAFQGDLEKLIAKEDFKPIF